MQVFVSRFPVFFAGTRGDWKAGIRLAYHLSDSIDVAVLDLWFRNRANAQADGWTLQPWHFAQLFAQNYFAEGSRVDVWEGNALAEARTRIHLARHAPGAH